MDPEIGAYYALGMEAGRLNEGPFVLERARTQEVLLRHLSPPPGVVLDVGGGAGAYALWLASRGYQAHLVDPVPLHVAQAQEASERQHDHALASARVGDARSLEWPDAFADAVLLVGPLYHLVARDDRVRALREARRVLRPGGLVFAGAISRFASMLDGLKGALFEDPAFEAIVLRDLTDGQHRNTTGRPEYFTTAFFHRAEELAAEVRAAGLCLQSLLGLEGPCWTLPDFEARWRDAAGRQKLMALARAVESEPSLLGISAHLLAVAQRD